MSTSYSYKRTPRYVREIQAASKPPAPLNPFLVRASKRQPVPRPYSRPLQQELQIRHPPHIHRMLPQQIAYAQAGVGQGSRTRGWRAAAPKRGSERHRLRQICGDQCFLMPEQEKFPICPACLPGDPRCGGCRPDCRGVTAAKSRAGQWKYPQVYAQAEELQRVLRCPSGRKRQ